MEMKFVKASELLERKEFLTELGTKESDEEVVALFKKYDVELTLEDVDKMCEESIAYAKEREQEGELDEDALGEVSGGFVITTAGCFAEAVANISFYIYYGISRYGKGKKRSR